MLEETLKKPENSVVREKLFKHRFLYDVQLAFLSRGHSILYYESDYDKDGFDLLFDSLGTQKHIQMKSILSSSKRSTFDVHRTLLRPKTDELNNFPLSHDGFGAGYGGGVVLIEADVVDDTVNLKYRFCDGLILTAFYSGYFRYKSQLKQNSVNKVFASFQDPRSMGGSVTLTKSCFVEFKSILALFDYLGLGGYGDVGHCNLLRAVARKYGLCNTVDRKYSVEDWQSIVRHDFNDLVEWGDIQC